MKKLALIFATLIGAFSLMEGMLERSKPREVHVKPLIMFEHLSLEQKSELEKYAYSMSAEHETNLNKRLYLYDELGATLNFRVNVTVGACPSFRGAPVTFSLPVKGSDFWVKYAVDLYNGPYPGEYFGLVKLGVTGKNDRVVDFLDNIWLGQTLGKITHQNQNPCIVLD